MLFVPATPVSLVNVLTAGVSSEYFIKIKVPMRSGTRFQKEMGTNNDMRTFFFLVDESFTLSSAKFNDKQITKCTNLKRLTLPPQTERSKIKQAMN
jgi:hypothetical protein